MYLRLSLLALAICTAAKAAVIIQPDTATASSSFSEAFFSPVNTINGSGLLGPVGSLPNHAEYSGSVPAGGNHWTTNGIIAPTNNWIEWGFNTPQTLNTVYIWNHQSNNIASNAGYDVGNFALTFYNSFNVVISTYSSTLAFDSASPQAFDFGLLTGISSVRFDIDSVQSSTDFTGLAEVAFSNVPSRNRVPDDSTSGLMLLFGLISTGVLSRKMRRV